MDYINHMIEGNWKKMKGCIQEHWGKLTEQDIEEIDGKYLTLKGKLQEVYGYQSAETEKAILEFIFSNNFDRLKSNAIDKMQDMEQAISSTFREYFGSAKKKSIDLENSILDCINKNPLKSLGIAAAAVALVCGCIFRR